MTLEKMRVASGVNQLDHLLDGLYIGDNVVWYDDAGSLAAVFCLNFIKISQTQNKSLIYVSFDRSPKNLLDKLGSLAKNKNLTILDCFTHGKGEGSDVFLKFYEQRMSEWPCQIIKLDEPAQIHQLSNALYGIHETLHGDVRFVFESLTGMQKLWGGEQDLIDFYSHACPRLYELNTIAYWVIEKRAHSPRLRAQINQIAQVAIDLSVKRGKTFLTILKAEKRDLDALNMPFNYWRKGSEIIFDSEKRSAEWVDLGNRLKDLRKKRGLSQAELAKFVGVTPSTISQVESHLIYPSLPALFKMAEVLNVEVSSLFQDSMRKVSRVIFPAAEAVDVKLPNMPQNSIHASLLRPVDFESKTEPYLIEIPPNSALSSHFFIHKGEEIGYLLSGVLQLKMETGVYTARANDVIYLTTEIPSQWENPGPETARLLWMKIN